MSIDKSQHVITRKDQEDMTILEAEIAKNEKAFLRVAEILIEIQTRKLYFIYADTFESYVKEKWGWSEQRAYQIIDSKYVVDALPEKTQPLVESERAARALAKVPVKHRVPVLEQLKNGKTPITAKAISEAAKRPNIPMPPEDNGVVDVEEIVYDSTGFKIPEHRVAFYKRGHEPKELLRAIATVRGALRSAEEAKDPLFAFVNKSTTMSLLDNAYGELKMAIPFVVCPYCQGQTADNCSVCRKTGFLPEHQWKHAVPSDLKAVREKSCKK